MLMDSTYALAKKSFPAQAEVVDAIVADLADVAPETLVLIAAYSVGKERNSKCHLTLKNISK